MSTFSSDWIVLQDAGGDMPPARAMPIVAKAMRDTLMSLWQGLIPEIVSGHAADGSPSKHPHLAAIPLLDVGRDRSAGRMMGLALVLPSSSHEVELREAINAASNGAFSLRLGELGVWQLSVCAQPPSGPLAPAQYCEPSRTWASVTPLILDKHPSEKNAGEEMKAIVADACIRSGLPNAEVETMGASEWTGAPPCLYGSRPWGPDGWMLPRRRDGSPHPFGSRLTRHAKITFPLPVRGPVILGSGRFLGLGLCRAVDK